MRTEKLQKKKKPQPKTPQRKKHNKSRLILQSVDSIGSSTNQRYKRKAEDSSDDEHQHETESKTKKSKQIEAVELNTHVNHIESTEQPKKKRSRPKPSSFDKMMKLFSVANSKATVPRPAPTPKVARTKLNSTDDQEQDEEHSTEHTSQPTVSCTHDHFGDHFSRVLTATEVEAFQPTQMTHKQSVENLGVLSSSKPITLCRRVLKPSLQTAAQSLPKDGIVPDTNDSTGLTQTTEAFLDLLNQQTDVLFCNQTHQNTNALRKAYIIHALDHLMKRQHKGKQTQSQEESEAQEGHHGFTRPSVLILCPFRQSALEILSILMTLTTQDHAQVDNKKKLLEEYAAEDGVIIDTSPQKRKPIDHQLTFRGNADDCFRIGAALYRKSLKLYTEFYASDIIIASPLGLHMITNASDSAKKNGEADFLSSIELLVIDSADVMLMQNFDHVTGLTDLVNRIPQKPRDTDFSKIRPYFLEGWAKYYRQSIILSGYQHPEINNIFNRMCSNMSGRVRISPEVFRGVLHDIEIGGVVQMFQRFDCESVAELADSRFEYFTTQFIPNVLKKKLKNVLIYLPSYFDFVRLRNWMEKKDMNFGALSEYNKTGKTAKIRQSFIAGELDFVLYTERFHFFRRLNIKGANHIVFFGPPNVSVFYRELVSFLKGRPDATATLLFSLFDCLALERIVGSSRVKKVLTSPSDTLVFS